MTNELFDKWGSDKGILHGPAHGYGPVYETLTANRNIECLIEVGVEFGNSLMAWGEAFPAAEICGIDRALPTGFTLPSGKQVKLATADQNNLETFLESDEILSWPKADIIIDDGGHCMNHHWVTLAGLWDKLKPGGIYVIEDVHTCNLSSDFSMYGQPLQNDCITTLDVLYSFMSSDTAELTGRLRNPWVKKETMDRIADEVYGIDFYKDNMKRAYTIEDFDQIQKHGLAVIHKKA